MGEYVGKEICFRVVLILKNSVDSISFLSPICILCLVNFEVPLPTIRTWMCHLVKLNCFDHLSSTVQYMFRCFLVTAQQCYGYLSLVGLSYVGCLE